VPCLETRDEIELAWSKTREELREIFRNILPSIGEIFTKIKTEPIVHALAGEIGHAFARVERMVVTRMGVNSWRIIRHWFPSYEKLDKPWDMRVDCRGRTYTVKIVLSPRTLNSTLRQRVERESTRMTNPIILTLTGLFNGQREQQLGNARWLDAGATWYWLSGERGAYRKFLAILYDEAYPLRRELLSRIYDTYRQIVSVRRKNV